jgi:hypothetical protein
MKTHLVTWWWKGWRDIYTSRDVRALARMIRLYHPDLRLVCITDQPDNAWYPCEMERAPLWPEPTGVETRGKPTCFRRLKLFDFPTLASMGVEVDDVVISMDLDSIVAGPFLPPILRNLETSTFTAMGGVAARIHASLWAFRAGSHQDLWRNFNPERTPVIMHLEGYNKGMHRQIGSDQAYMSYKMPKVPLLQREDGMYSWNRHGVQSPRWTENAVYWSFAGHNKPRNHLVKQVRPDLHSLYLDAYGRE